MNLEADLQILQERIAKAERHSRSLQWLIVIAMLVWVPLMLLKLSKPKRFVEAEGFILKDANGITRGTLGFFEDGSFLHLHDEKEKLRLSLSVTRFGPSLSISNAEENLRGHLFATEKAVNFMLYSEEEKSRISLSMTKNGPTVTLSDPSGIDRARLGRRSKKEEKERSSQEDYALDIFDEAGNLIFSGP